MEAKYCSKCGLVKPISEFHKDRTKKSGYKSACKKCLSTPERKEYTLNYANEHKENFKIYGARFRERHRKKLKEYARQYRKDNPNATKEYYERNKDRIKEKCRLYKNSEQGKEACRKYKKSEKYKACKHRYRVKRRGYTLNGDADINPITLFKRDKGVCQLCGGICDWYDYKISNGLKVVGAHYPSVDHIIPLTKGGTHTWDNVQLAHFYCNSCKRDKIA